MYKKREGFRVERLPDVNIVHFDEIPEDLRLYEVAWYMLPTTEEAKGVLRRYNLDTDKPAMFIATHEGLEKKKQEYEKKLREFQQEYRLKLKEDRGFQPPEIVSGEKGLKERVNFFEDLIRKYDDPLTIRSIKRHEHGHIELYHKFKKFGEHVHHLSDLNEEGAFIIEVLGLVEDVNAGLTSTEKAREFVKYRVNDWSKPKKGFEHYKQAISKILENKPLYEHLRTFDTEKLASYLEKELEKVLFLAQERSKIIERVMSGEEDAMPYGWNETDKEILSRWKKK